VEELTAAPALFLALADGTRAQLELCLVGPDSEPGFMCPFCGYPSTNRVPACDNPWCDTRLDAAALAARREAQAARAAEEAARRRDHDLAMERIRESREAEQARYNQVMERCDREGKCRACAGRRLRAGGELRLVAHRDPANCPERRRYAA
jgi:hypothetical protein